jgi:flagellar motor switch protein FliN
MSEQPLTPASLIERLAYEVANAVSSLAGEQTTVSAGPVPGDTQWLVTLSASGLAAGELQVGLTDEDARRISATVMGFDPSEVADDAIADTLRELSGQAIGALRTAPATAGVLLAIVDVTRASFPGEIRGSFRFTLAGDQTPALVLGADITLEPPAAGPVQPQVGAPEPAVAAAPASKNITLPTATSGNPGNLDLILDIELPMSVRFGQAELSLLTLTRLGPGSVIDLHRSADEPVEVLISGKVVAKGEVVVVEGNYGVRVTEVVSTVDRIRTLGA